MGQQQQIELDQKQQECFHETNQQENSYEQNLNNMERPSLVPMKSIEPFSDCNSDEWINSINPSKYDDCQPVTPSKIFAPSKLTRNFSNSSSIMQPKDQLRQQQKKKVALEHEALKQKILNGKKLLEQVNKQNAEEIELQEQELQRLDLYFANQQLINNMDSIISENISSPSLASM